MIFLATLLIKLLLAICTTLILIKLLNPIINNTLQKVFSGDLHKAWTKYIQIAFFILGVSSGINLYTLRDFILKTNKNLSLERLISEGWETISSSSLALMMGMLGLFFLFLIVTYLNQLSASNASSTINKNKEEKTNAVDTGQTKE